MNRAAKICSSEDFSQKRKAGLNKLYPDKVKVSVGMASCGLAAGAGKVFDKLKRYIEENKLDVVLSPSGCIGFCRMEPLVTVHKPGQSKMVYSNISADKAEDFLQSVLKGDKSQQALCRIDEEELIVDDGSQKLALKENGQNSTVPYNEIPFFKKQKRIVLRNCGFIDSDDIDEYIGRSGYSALLKTLTAMTPENVIDQVKLSGLRGRGGGGFPTGIKWELCRLAEGHPKYVVCNADEGDPGAYMDRSVLEGDPHSVIEGMTIGAYAIGAAEGFIYVRAEYPLAIEKLRTAIDRARQYGLLGENIFGTEFSFDVTVVEGLGAFVCGEETSLIASIEGQPAEPLPRPPFPAQSGLWSKPTNINNVETWANIPVIIARGGDWYSGIGDGKSRGTKVFSLVGAVNNTGLVEVPMGTSLREIVYDIGEGIREGRELKAIQTGGPSGGCVPADLVDLPVDYERLAEIGSIMGSGGLVVMDEENCMVDIARYFTAFTRDESCGKCISCRDGLDAAHDVLTRITDGKADDNDMELLEELSETIRETSQCGLGKTAPNPILSTIKYFRSEYEQHVKEKKCSAGACKSLIKYEIVTDKCKSCGKCKAACPVGAIEGHKEVPYRITPAICTKCGACYDICPFEAVIRI